MKLFVIGATGRTGSEVVEQAVARGHQVTAFVRSPESLKLKNERLTVINGDVMDEDQLANHAKSRRGRFGIGTARGFKAAGSTGQSPAPRVSLRKIPWPIEVARALRPGWVSLSPAKQLQHSYSTRSSKGNIFARS
jgi:cation diffusion facilitator CzcD-associated flavoprotein CzcO